SLHDLSRRPAGRALGAESTSLSRLSAGRLERRRGSTPKSDRRARPADGLRGCGLARDLPATAVLIGYRVARRAVTSDQIPSPLQLSELPQSAKTGHMARLGNFPVTGRSDRHNVSTSLVRLLRKLQFPLDPLEGRVLAERIEERFGLQGNQLRITQS